MNNLQTITNSLRIQAETFLREEFNLPLTVPVKLNGRLKSTLGRFKGQLNRFTGERTPLSIEISKEFLMHNEWEVVIDVLKHECVHYALFVQNLPHNDSDRTFIEACTSRAISLTRVIKAKRIQKVIECNKCGEQWLENTARIKGYAHKNCGGSLSCVGERVSGE